MPTLPRTKSFPNTLPSLTATPETAYATEKHGRRITYEGNVPTLDATVPDQDRSAMASRLAECDKLLVPFNVSEHAQLALALSLMFAGFNDSRPMDVEAIIANCIRAFASLPFWAVSETISDIECGRVEGLSPDFRPTVARIYQIAEARLNSIRLEKTQIETILNARAHNVPLSDPEEVQRIAAKMMAFSEDFSKKVGTEQKNDDPKKREKAQRDLEHSDNALLAEYRAHGFKPIFVNGRPMCLSLARGNGVKLEPIASQAETPNRLTGTG